MSSLPSDIITIRYNYDIIIIISTTSDAACPNLPPNTLITIVFDCVYCTDVRDDVGQSPLDNALRGLYTADYRLNACCVDVSLYLMSRGCACGDKDKAKLLCAACCCGDLDAVKKLVELHKVDPKSE